MRLSEYDIERRGMIISDTIHDNPRVKFCEDALHEHVKYIAWEAFRTKMYLKNGDLKDWYWNHDLIECITTCRVDDNLVGIGVKRKHTDLYDRNTGFFVKSAYRGFGIGNHLFKLLYKKYGTLNVSYGTLSGQRLYYGMLKRFPKSCEIM